MLMEIFNKVVAAQNKVNKKQPLGFKSHNYIGSTTKNDWI